ncbi:uncharacterized protein DNG_09519 [Cephalotrichum gorgonifer]|uniref:Uncharacterized protein n=1 Tax=Cephalotrichum gorgonifer TaxID=2041049 RepID=A0AAE8SZD2_9PEZI|nr:uncharacterized protein DNG_09519 [Cephalotrichum gorgonifer]
MREEEGLRKFHSNFIIQHELLKHSPEISSTALHQHPEILQDHTKAWSIAIMAMRRMSKVNPPSLIGVLCFLLVSRAMARTLDGDGNQYLTAFSEELNQWRQVYPEVEDVARRVWGHTFSDLPLPRSPVQHTTLLQLRDKVAALIGKARRIIDLGDWTQHMFNKTSQASHQREPTNAAETLPDIEPSLPPEREEKEPPDRLICPNIVRLQEIPEGLVWPEIVTLVTGIIFAIVVYFMLDCTAGCIQRYGVGRPFVAFEALNSHGDLASPAPELLRATGAEWGWAV